MKIICIIIILYLTSHLFSQEFSQSSSSITTNQQLLPFDFKFYHVPNLYENPVLEYDEIVIPYQKYIQPELTKHNIDANVLSPNLSHNLRNFGVMLGQAIDLLAMFSLYSKRNTLDFSLGYNNYNVINKTEQENFIKYFFIAKLNHISANTITFTLNTKFHSLRLWSPIYLLNLSSMIKKVILDTYDITYVPEIYCLTKNDVTKILLSNSLIGNIFLTDKFLISPGVKLLFLDDNEPQHLFATSIIKTKKLFLNTTFMTMLEYNINFHKLYYSTELNYKILNYILLLFFKKDLYYQYISEYFTNIPGVILLQQDKLYCGDRILTGLKIDYKATPFYFSTEVINSKYSKFPSYLYENGLVKPYFVNDVNMNKFAVVAGFDYSDFKTQLQLVYSSFQESIYFIPRLTISLNFNKNINKNLQVSQKFVYQDALKVNVTQAIPFCLTSTTIISYKISSNIICSFNYFIPMINKHYIHPDVHTPAFFQLGIQVKF